VVRRVLGQLKDGFGSEFQHLLVLRHDDLGLRLKPLQKLREGKALVFLAMND
jgi:hypothetical protein